MPLVDKQNELENVSKSESQLRVLNVQENEKRKAYQLKEMEQIQTQELAIKKQKHELSLQSEQAQFEKPINEVNGPQQEKLFQPNNQYTQQPTIGIHFYRDSAVS